VAAAPTLILTGETGSGKSTQVPQFLRAAGYAETGAIGVTQPRRVAATSIARRVAAEAGVELGTGVGYSVRFDERFDRRPPAMGGTQIKYLTDGMLLREASSDPLLSCYAVLIIDEAHERSLQSDVALAILKTAQAARAGGGGAGPGPDTAGEDGETGAAGAEARPPAVSPPPWAASPPAVPGPRGLSPLKLIVMSATLEIDRFCEFFGGAPAVQVLGRSFPVDVLFTREPCTDYLDACVTTVMQVKTKLNTGREQKQNCG